MNPSFEVGLG